MDWRAAALTSLTKISFHSTRKKVQVLLFHLSPVLIHFQLTCSSVELWLQDRVLTDLDEALDLLTSFSERPGCQEGFRVL